MGTSQSVIQSPTLLPSSSPSQPIAFDSYGASGQLQPTTRNAISELIRGVHGKWDNEGLYGNCLSAAHHILKNASKRYGYGPNQMFTLRSVSRPPR